MKTNQLTRMASAIVLFIILSCSFKATAQTSQYVTLYSNGQGHGFTGYPVQTNQIVSVVGYDWADKPQLQGSFPDGTSINLTPFFTYNSTSTATHTIESQIPQIFTGLTNIDLAPVSNNGLFFGAATFQITTPTCVNVVSNYVPADAIVIPASATGNVQIILESSTDLVNWTAASPGTYGASSATNRFFRVRAVLN